MGEQASCENETIQSGGLALSELLTLFSVCCLHSAAKERRAFVTACIERRFREVQGEWKAVPELR